jgi:4-hydroxy-tetrahydrodipicolinate synthase
LDRSTIDWRGNFCAVVTPFAEDGRFSEEMFGQNLQLLLSEGIDGFVVAGHTGESWTLDDNERFRAFELAVEVASGRVPVIGNVSAIRTADAISLAKAAEARGLNGVLLTGPAYAMVTEREIFAHFQGVSDHCTLPIMIYNIPRRIGRDLSPEFIHSATEIDRVVALKQSSPSFDDIARVIDRSGDRLLVFAGNSAERGLPAVAVGADGFVSSVETQALGAEAISLWQLSQNGDMREARAVQQKCSLVKSFLNAFGTEPAALKVAMNHNGRPGGFTRPPILPLSEEESTSIRTFIDQFSPVVA